MNCTRLAQTRSSISDYLPSRGCRGAIKEEHKDRSQILQLIRRFRMR